MRVNPVSHHIWKQRKHPKIRCGPIPAASFGDFYRFRQEHDEMPYSFVLQTKGERGMRANRFISLVLAVVTALSLAACGKTGTEKETAQTAKPSRCLTDSHHCHDCQRLCGGCAGIFGCGHERASVQAHCHGRGCKGHRPEYQQTVKTPA